MILTICVRVHSSRSRVCVSIIMKSRASISFDYSRQKEKERKEALTSVYEAAISIEYEICNKLGIK